METDWMKQISNESICNFFYVFFVIYALFAVLSLVSFIGVFTFMKVPKGVLAVHGVQAFISLGIATTMMLFLYLICDRALNPKKEKKE
jgi:hypothetical protein